MEKYITQLLEVLQKAKQNRSAPSYIELDDEKEGLRAIIELERSMEEPEQTMEQIFGVEQVYFPPENRLTDTQIQNLVTGIVELWRFFRYEPEFGEETLSEREQYTKLIQNWKEEVPVFRGNEGTWHIELYEYD